MSVDYIAHPVRQLHGEVRVPGDKSISHRSIMLGSIANGVTHINGFLWGADALATMHAFQSMGVGIQHQDEKITIHGVGLHGLKAPQKQIDLGNSGTAMRLMMGLLAGQDFDVQLTGDESLCARPMKRIVGPLEQMGAKFVTTEGRAPLLINNTARKGQKLNGIHYTLPMASAQVKSAILLAGLYAEGQTCVTEPAITRDHTERMLSGLHYSVATTDNKICLQGKGALTAVDIDIPADISSAAFLIVAAAMLPGSDLRLKHVGVNPTRIGIIHILRDMGANITLQNKHDVGGEPVADIQIQGGPLRGIRIPAKWVPLAIDEFPVIAIAAACAEGETHLTGAEELRVKESDRILAIVSTLTALGIDAKESPDGFIIQGKGSRDASADIFTGGKIQSFADHRIAMAATIASLRASGPIAVIDCDNVATSFPGYVQMLNSLGFHIDVQESIAENE